MHVDNDAVTNILIDVQREMMRRKHNAKNAYFPLKQDLHFRASAEIKILLLSMFIFVGMCEETKLEDSIELVSTYSLHFSPGLSLKRVPVDRDRAEDCAKCHSAIL